jgi:hypothetical protein
MVDRSAQQPLDLPPQENRQQFSESYGDSEPSFDQDPPPPYAQQRGHEGKAEPTYPKEGGQAEYSNSEV